MNSRKTCVAETADSPEAHPVFFQQDRRAGRFSSPHWKIRAPAALAGAAWWHTPSRRHLLFAVLPVPSCVSRRHFFNPASALYAADAQAGASEIFCPAPEKFMGEKETAGQRETEEKSEERIKSDERETTATVVRGRPSTSGRVSVIRSMAKQPGLGMGKQTVLLRKARCNRAERLRLRPPRHRHRRSRAHPPLNVTSCRITLLLHWRYIKQHPGLQHSFRCRY